MRTLYEVFGPDLERLRRQHRYTARQLGMTDDDTLDAVQRPSGMPIEKFKRLTAKLAEIEANMAIVSRQILQQLEETDPTFRR
jgi:endonuclease III-like uncharacterized protein